MDDYVLALRQARTNVARACRPGARLIVRFGVLLSHRGPDALEVFRETLHDTPWRMRWVCSAGSAEHGNLQAKLFLISNLVAREEPDVLAVLDG